MSELSGALDPAVCHGMACIRGARGRPGSRRLRRRPRPRAHSAAARVGVTRFKLDENLPSRAAVLVRDAGHDVSTALDEDLGGSSDATVAKACADEGRVLVTPDLHRGLLQRSLPALAAVDLQGSIAIVEPERMRTWRPGD